MELARVQKRLERFCDRVPSHARDEVSYHWTLRGNQITLFERRPTWRGEPGEVTDISFARFQFNPEAHVWTLKWSDRNGRFHPYEGFERRRSFDALVDEIDSDPTGIFFG